MSKLPALFGWKSVNMLIFRTALNTDKDIWKANMLTIKPAHHSLR
jgi:hypothetical protein